MGNCFPFKNRRRRHRGFYESSQMKGGKEGEREKSEVSTFLEQGQVGRLKTWKDNASPPLVKIVT